MRTTARRAVLAAAAFGVVLAAGTAATAAPAVTFPKFTAPVVDAAGVVPNNVETAVNQQLNSYQHRTGNQIAVAVVKSTGDESIETYARQLFNQWGVGQRSINNGVLLVIAYNDHKLRIEVGDGLRSELTDSDAAAIVADDIVPMMKANNISSAILLGTTGIRRSLGDPLAESDAAPADLPSSSGSSTTRTNSSSGAVVLLIFVAIFVVVGVLGAIGGAGRMGYRSPSVWGPSYGYYGRPRGFWGWGGGGFWGNGGGGGSGWNSGGGSSFGGGGGGFSSGGGGFSGGGGGSSSGGGASGSW